MLVSFFINWALSSSFWEYFVQEKTRKLNSKKSFKKGDLVKHKIFGIGRVQEVSRSGKDYKLKINFGGNKKEILSSFVEHI